MKKLGENNTRIQPYMTESAYSQELSSQNDAMNQVYKDYILDYHFEKADIFVNQTTNQAIAMISYEVRTGKETDITTSYQQDLKRLIADNNSDIESSQKKIEELHTLIDTKNKDNKKLQSIYDAISELH